MPEPLRPRRPSEAASPIATIVVPNEAWQEAGPDEDRRAALLCHLVVNGQSLHLEAWAVHDDAEYDGHEADYEILRHRLLYLEDGADANFEATEMDGRSYVIFATPYGR